jgi:hypothetical protein
MLSILKPTTIAAGLALGLTGAASAATVTVVANAPTSWGLVDTTQTTVLTGGEWATAPSTVSGSVANEYKSPFDPAKADNGANVPVAQQVPGWQNIDYFTVGSPGLAASPAIMNITLGTAAWHLSLLWGSLDEYNIIQFFRNGLEVASATGGQVLASGGEPSASGAAFVKLFVDGGFDQVHFRSDAPAFLEDTAAFEFSNVTAAVPLPAGGLLLITALGGIALLRRRKQAAA